MGVRVVAQVPTTFHVAGHNNWYPRPVGPVSLPTTFSPATLNARLVSRRGGCDCGSFSPEETPEPSRRRRRRNRPRKRRRRSPPVNILLCDDLAVRMREHNFQLESLIRNKTIGGVVTTDLDLFGPTLATVSLSVGSSKMLSLPNAGGSSVLSEVMSCELLGRCYGAKLLKTEMEVEYWPGGGSITDYTCHVFGHHVGVSVTRAMAYYEDFTREHACRLLTKKLKGVVQSSRNVVDRWTKQILHVWALSQHDADVTANAYHHLDSDVTTNTVVLITVASNADEIFRNR